MSFTKTTQLIFVSLAVIVLVVGYNIGLAVQADWPREPGGQWSAVGAVAGIVESAATVSAIFAVLYASRSLRTSELEHRLHTLPFFKVYIGFPCIRDPSFEPPQERLLAVSRHQVLADQETIKILDDIDSDSEGAHELAIWLENLQTAPLGVGLGVILSFAVRWRHLGKQEIRETGVTSEYLYVGAAQTVRISLVSVGGDVDYIGITPLAVEYCDINGRQFRGGFGPATFEYDASRGEVRNEPVEF